MYCLTLVTFRKLFPIVRFRDVIGIFQTHFPITRDVMIWKINLQKEGKMKIF